MIESTETISHWLSVNSTRLQGITESSLNDVRVLLSNHLNVNPSWIASHSDEILSSSTLTGLEEKMNQVDIWISPALYIEALGIFWIGFLYYSGRPDPQAGDRTPC